jgi:hypothetical protein
LASTGLYGRNASAQVAAIPPTRFGHMRISSTHPGAAAQLSSSPIASNGIAAVPCVAMIAPSRNRLWLLPPIASAVVLTHPSVRG